MVQRTEFDIISAFYPHQANTIHNLFLQDKSAFRALYPDLAAVLNMRPDKTQTPQSDKNPHHHETCPCARCRPAPPPAPTPAEVRRKRACIVTETKPTTYREGFFATRPVKDFGDMPRWAEFITNKAVSNGWAWGAVTKFDGKAAFFETYWPLSCVK